MHTRPSDRFLSQDGDTVVGEIDPAYVSDAIRSMYVRTFPAVGRYVLPKSNVYEGAFVINGSAQIKSQLISPGTVVYGTRAEDVCVIVSRAPLSLFSWVPRSSGNCHDFAAYAAYPNDYEEDGLGCKFMRILDESIASPVHRLSGFRFEKSIVDKTIYSKRPLVVYVLNGHAVYRFQYIEESCSVGPGSCLTITPRMKHEIIVTESPLDVMALSIE